MLGCTGETVIGGSREIENGPALSLWSGVLPGADLIPFQMEFEETPDGIMCSGLPDDMGAGEVETRAVLPSSSSAWRVGSNCGHCSFAVFGLPERANATSDSVIA